MSASCPGACSIGGAATGRSKARTSINTGSNSMTRKQSQMFLEMHAMVTQTSKDVDYILNKVAVNGSRGLEPVLKDNHEKREKLQQSVNDLANRTGLLERINAKAASTYELLGAAKKWADQRKWAAVIFKAVFNKVMFRISVGFIIFILALLFGDRASSMLWKIFHLIK